MNNVIFGIKTWIVKFSVALNPSPKTQGSHSEVGLFFVLDTHYLQARVSLLAQTIGDSLSLLVLQEC